MAKKLDIGASKSDQIARMLEGEIKAGAVPQGARLDSESALVRRFSVSRNTVRRSLETLSRQGLITTRTGIGSFVTYSGNTINNDRGWTLALSGVSDSIGTRVLRISRGFCGATGETMPADTDCLCVDRLRFRTDTGRGLSLERSRLPWRSAFEGIPENGLINGSLSDTLSELSIHTSSGEEWAHVHPGLSREDALVMGREEGEPMLRLRRLTRSADGGIVEFVETLLAPKHFGLHMEF